MGPQNHNSAWPLPPFLHHIPYSGMQHLCVAFSERTLSCRSVAGSAHNFRNTKEDESRKWLCEQYPGVSQLVEHRAVSAVILLLGAVLH